MVKIRRTQNLNCNQSFTCYNPEDHQVAQGRDEDDYDEEAVPNDPDPKVHHLSVSGVRVGHLGVGHLVRRRIVPIAVDLDEAKNDSFSTFFVNFCLFKQKLQVLQQTNVKNVHSVYIQRWDSNPRPLEHEYPPITARSGLPTFLFQSLSVAGTNVGFLLQIAASGYQTVLRSRIRILVIMSQTNFRLSVPMLCLNKAL